MSVIALVLCLTGCAVSNPYLDPCYRAVKCVVINGQREYRDPSATTEYGGSGAGVRYQSPQTLTIRNTQGRTVGTIR